MSAARWLRTSLGRWAGLVVVVVLVVHLVSRSWTWRYEWLRAVLQLTFSSVFLGPLAAGFATWEGSRWARAQMPHVAGRPKSQAAMRAWLALSAWLVAPLLATSVLVVLVVKLNGMPGWPSPADLRPLAAALALLLGWTAIGFVLGWRSASTVLAAPLVAALAFAATVALWGGPGTIMQVGGTYTTLVGLQVNASVPAGQVLFWAGVVMACGGALSVRRNLPLIPVVALLVGLAVSFAGFRVSESSDGLIFHAAPTAVRCRPLEHGTSLCLAPGYESHRGVAEATVERALARWRAAGLEAPSTFTQVFDGRGPDKAWLDDRDILHGDVNDVEWQLVNTLVSGRCDTFSSATTRAAFRQIASAVVRDPEGATAPPTPASVAPLPPAQLAAVRLAARDLARCRVAAQPPDTSS